MTVASSAQVGDSDCGKNGKRATAIDEVARLH